MTERQRQLLWRRANTQRERFVRTYSKAWVKALGQQIKAVIDEIDESTVQQIEHRIPMLITEDPIKDLWEDNAVTVAVFFAGQTLRSLAKHYGPELITKDGGIPTDEEWKLQVQGILWSRGGDRITSITGESREQAINIVQASLYQSTQNGLGASQMSQDLRDRLREDWDYISTYRAARIARTETHAASNLGSLEAARLSDEPMQKVWLSTRDSRTRRRRGRGTYDHYGKFPSGPDGEKVDLGEKFVKTGEALDHPGDYRGSGGNVIHCRCVMYYEPLVDDTEGAGVRIDPPTPEPPKPPPRPIPPKLPPKPKPTKLTRKQQMAKVKKAIKDHPTMKKAKTLVAEKNALNKQLDDVIKDTNRANKDFWGGAGQVSASEAEHAAYQARRAALDAKRTDLLSRIRSLDSEIKHLMKNADDILAEIVDLGDVSNVSITVTNIPEGKKKYIDNFLRIIGKVEGKDTVNFKLTYKVGYGRANSSTLWSSDTAATFMHEFGHNIEDNVKEVWEATRALMDERCMGDKLTAIYKGTQEKGFKDEWINHYTGKLYAWSKPRVGTKYDPELMRRTYGTEVFSMWFTHFIENPIAFMEQDPRHFEWGLDLIYRIRGLK